MSDYRDIRAEFEESYRDAQSFWASFVTNANVYTNAAAGNIWSPDEIRELQKQGREPLSLNIMRRPLQFYSGYLRDNIHSVYVAPIEGSDQQTADDFTDLSLHVWNKGGGYRKFCDYADEAAKAGISLFGIYMDYTKDFINGDIKFFGRTYNSFYLDPTFEDPSLQDCSYAILRDIMSKEAVKALLPFVDQEVIDDIYTSFRDEKFPSYYPQFISQNRWRPIIAYDQFYKKEMVTKRYLINQDTGFGRPIDDLSREEYAELKERLAKMNDQRQEFELFGMDGSQIPRLKIEDRSVEEVKLHILLNGQHVFSGHDRTGIKDRYPFAPILCYLEPSIYDPAFRIQGIAATNYNVQREFNKRHMKINDIMDSVISTGFKYFIGAVPDPTDMQQSGQNRLIGVDPENAPEGLNSVQELRGGDAPQSLLEYQSILDKLSLHLANVNETLLGSDEGGNTQISGLLAQVRTGNGVRSSRKFFDNINKAQEIVGNLVIQAIQLNYPPAKVERILGRKPSPQFYNKEFEYYDCYLKQGVLTHSQRDAYYQELVNLKREGIVDVPQSEIIKSLPLTNKTEFLKAIEQMEQAQQEQQKQIQQQELLGMELANSQKEENLSLAEKRRGKIIQDFIIALQKVEKMQTESDENRANAELDRARAEKELSQVSEERLMNAIRFYEEIKDRRRQEAEMEKQQTTDQALALAQETKAQENPQMEVQNGQEG